MEFTGRVKQLLPVRCGVSQRTGNEWKALPFIFEYFENPTDRYADSVVLETFDTQVIEHLKEGMEVRCGFSHRTRDYEGKTYNELRLYKIESIRKPTNQPAQASQSPTSGNQQGQQAQAQQQPANQPFPPQVDANGNPINQGGKTDDLPF